MQSHSIILSCKQCNDPFKVSPERLKSANVQFCSYGCRRSWNITHGKTKTPHTCKQCASIFMARKRDGRLYCSQKCYWRSKELTEERVCPICGKAFHVCPSEPNRFCSRACRDIWQSNKEERSCQHCGETFIIHPHRADIYCSQSCALRARGTKRKKTYPIHVCAKCGKEFEHKRKDTTGKYCSRACSDSVNKNPPAQEWIAKKCAYCNQDFMCPPWHPEVEHCSGKCASLHRAQSIRGVHHPLWKDKVRVACQACGKVCHVKPSLASRFRACSKPCTGILSMQAQRGRVSSIEKKIQAAMQEIGLEPIPQYVIAPYIADFAFIEQRLVVECDGDYWHGNAKRQAKDRQKDGHMQHAGWRVLRLPEHLIHSDINNCIQQITAALNNIG